MPLKLLDFATFEANAQKDPQWKSWRERWKYHEKAIAIVRYLNLSRPKSVLELGCFGAGLVAGSDRMDLPGSGWNIPGDRKTILHDARVIPWPIKDRRYELLISLRVWHHLAPVQRECFAEARRVSRAQLIVCPEKEVVGVGVFREQWDDWYGGPPDIVQNLGEWGFLYFFQGEESHAETL